MGWGGGGGLLTSLIYVYRPPSPTGSQWSSGSAKQKYIKTTREGIGSAQLKHICPGGSGCGEWGAEPPLRRRWQLQRRRAQTVYLGNGIL